MFNENIFKMKTASPIYIIKNKNLVASCFSIGCAFWFCALVFYVSDWERK